jgi:hypothetical protein
MVTIRQMTPEDLLQVDESMTRLFGPSASFSLDETLEMLSHGNFEGVIAEEGGIIVGHAATAYGLQEFHFHIYMGSELLALSRKE